MEYATIARSQSQQRLKDLATIARHDREDCDCPHHRSVGRAQGEQAMRRPHATINLILGALVSRESTQRCKWGAMSASTRRESESGDCSARIATTTKQSRDDHARRELAICRDRNATINLIFFGAGLKRERPDAMWEQHQLHKAMSAATTSSTIQG